MSIDQITAIGLSIAAVITALAGLVAAISGAFKEFVKPKSNSIPPPEVGITPEPDNDDVDYDIYRDAIKQRDDAQKEAKYWRKIALGLDPDEDTEPPKFKQGEVNGKS